MRRSMYVSSRAVAGMAAGLALILVATLFGQLPARAAVVNKYYFISGNTFTPGGDVSYTRQVIGCVNQMPLNILFSAPVNLPQGAVVTGIRLYTYNDEATTTISTALFILNDGKGLSASTLTANSAPNTVGYQSRKNTVDNNTTIDNATYAYQVSWYTHGSSDSPILSLCGVRLLYHM